MFAQVARNLDKPRVEACNDEVQAGSSDAGAGKGERPMSPTTREPGGKCIELPATAPMIRLTAGAGSAGQKTWNIRRPVTLIGSCRPAHIVLHDKDVSKAHCVIVNTGNEVLISDLHTGLGTFRKQRRVGLGVLQDGDVIVVGKTRIQVAIQMPTDSNEDSGWDVEYVEPTKYSKPFTVRLEHTDQEWRIEDAVVMIGRHGGAEIRVDHADVSSRHAILFKFANAPAIYDIGSRSGISVNGQAAPNAGLREGDRVALGPCTLTIGELHAPVTKPVDGDGSSAIQTDSAPVEACAPGETEEDDPRNAPGASARGPEDAAEIFKEISECLSFSKISGDTGGVLDKLESDLAALQENIQISWDRVNAWEICLSEDASKLDKKKMGLAAREEELDAKEAALRGQLHDLTRFHEQIRDREQELAAQLANVQEREDNLAKAESEAAKREEEVLRRAEELKSREHVLAQRWARLQSTNCANCGKPIRATTPGGPSA